MYEALRYYIHARAHYLNAKAEKANMLPGDSHAHTAESEEMWKSAPDWTKAN